MEKEISGYELSRQWFDFCFENPEKVTPTHTAMYFFIIEHCNRLGWKEKFGLPMQMAKDAIGISNYRTYSKTFNDLAEWNFIKVVQRSKNQYSSSIIAIVKNAKAKSKALDKAIQKHSQKQVHGIVGIDKPNNLETFKQVVDVIKPVDFFRDNFSGHSLYRTLIEKEKFSAEQISENIEVFIDQKIGFNEIEGKDFQELCKNYYYWLPKYLRAKPPDKEKNSAKKESKSQQIIDNANDAITILHAHHQ